MATRRGNLGFGAIATGAISGVSEPRPSSGVVYFAGVEDIHFTPVGAPGVETVGNFRSAWVRCSLHTSYNSGTATENYYRVAEDFGVVAETAWQVFQVQQGTSAVGYPALFRWTVADAPVLALRARAGLVPELYSVNGGTYTLLKTGTVSMPDIGTLARLDTKMDLSGGICQVYIDKILSIDFSGDLTQSSSYSAITGLELGGGADNAYFSEVAWTTIDTREVGAVAALPPVSDGFATDWIGDAPDVNELILDEDTTNTTSIAGAVQEYTTLTLPGKDSVNVYAVVVGGRAEGANNLLIRTGGTDYLSSDYTPTLPTNEMYVWQTNPNTGIGFKLQDINTPEFNIGIKSRVGTEEFSIGAVDFDGSVRLWNLPALLDSPTGSLSWWMYNNPINEGLHETFWTGAIDHDGTYVLGTDFTVSVDYGIGNLTYSGNTVTVPSTDSSDPESGSVEIIGWLEVECTSGTIDVDFGYTNGLENAFGPQTVTAGNTRRLIISASLTDSSGITSDPYLIVSGGGTGTITSASKLIMYYRNNRGSMNGARNNVFGTVVYDSIGGGIFHAYVTGRSSTASFSLIVSTIAKGYPTVLTMALNPTTDVFPGLYTQFICEQLDWQLGLMDVQVLSVTSTTVTLDVDTSGLSDYDPLLNPDGHHLQIYGHAKIRDVTRATRAVVTFDTPHNIEAGSTVISLDFSQDYALPNTWRDALFHGSEHHVISVTDTTITIDVDTSWVGTAYDADDFGNRLSFFQVVNSFTYYLFDGIDGPTPNEINPRYTTPLPERSYTNILVSWDTDHDLGSKIFDMYFGDTLVFRGDMNDKGTNFDVRWSITPEDVGDDPPTEPPSDSNFGAGYWLLFGGLYSYVAEFWFDNQNRIDFSDSANRAKFHDDDGNPIFLGTQGELPTGSPPTIYLHIDADPEPAVPPASDFLINRADPLGENLRLNTGWSTFNLAPVPITTGGGGGGGGGDSADATLYKLIGVAVIAFTEVVRCPVGMAEYTETNGLTIGYLVKGALPGFATLRSQLVDKEQVRYRITNSQKEEVGEGWFDWPGNILNRTRFIVPTSGIDWGPGRKLIHIIEDYDDDVCLGATINPLSPLSVGIAEYTLTEGTGPYQLRGPVREFFTLLGRIPDGATVKYRATNVAKEEYGEGTFDAANNQLIRNAPEIPSTLINWGPGRKLIYINEK